MVDKDLADAVVFGLVEGLWEKSWFRVIIAAVMLYYKIIHGIASPIFMR